MAPTMRDEWHEGRPGRVRLELTRAGDYAVRAMLALAAHDAAGPLSSRRIAREWEIPQRFLTQVLRRLAEGGLATPVVGRHGGYRLARSPGQISLLDIIDAVEDPPTKGVCVLRGGPCRRDGTCLVHDTFTAAREDFLARLGEQSLAKLINGAGSEPWRAAPAVSGSRPPPL